MPLGLRDAGVVATGGCAGTWVRVGLDTLLAPASFGALAVSLVVVNLTGAFLLGWIQSAKETRRVSARSSAALGTGFLGAMTTYSSFIAASSSGVSGIVCALVLLAVGVLAALAGLALGHRFLRRQR